MEGNNDTRSVYITARAEEVSKAITECHEATRVDDNARRRDVARRLVKARSDLCRALQALDATWAVSHEAVNDVIDFDYPGREYLSDAEADQLSDALDAAVRKADCVG